MTPVLKWVGGKTHLLPALMKRLPRNPFGALRVGRYFEPFAGGAALFFGIQGAVPGTRAVLMDINPHLTNVYRAIQTHPESIIRSLRHHAQCHSKKHYYAVRAKWNDLLKAGAIPSEHPRIAAMFMYLNRTCFNGLYRENKDGSFNVPMGRYKNPKICDPDLIRAAQRALLRAEIVTGSYSTLQYAGGRYLSYLENEVRRHDVVYIDPPYHQTFSSYNKASFLEDDQRDLAIFAARLRDKGAFVMLSNSDTALIRKLYRGWKIERVSRPGTVSSKGAGRGRVRELIITSEAM